MATKKQRRRQLARASVERRQSRLSQRQLRNRRWRTAATLVLVIVVLLVLGVWITHHQASGSSSAVPTRPAGAQ